MLPSPAPIGLNWPHLDCYCVESGFVITVSSTTLRIITGRSIPASSRTDGTVRSNYAVQACANPASIFTISPAAKN